MAPKKRVRAAVKINTEGLAADDADIAAAADNKDMKRSDGTGGKFGGGGAQAGTSSANKHVLVPPNQYPVLPKEWSNEQVSVSGREREVCIKAKFLSNSYRYSGFFVRKSKIPPTTAAAAAAAAGSSVLSTSGTTSAMTNSEIERYSDKYRLIEGKKTILDEIPNMSDVIFPAELIKRLKSSKRTRSAFAGPAMNFESRFEALASESAFRVDEKTGVASFVGASSHLDELPPDELPDDGTGDGKGDDDSGAAAASGGGTTPAKKARIGPNGKPIKSESGEDGKPSADAESDEDAEEKAAAAAILGQAEEEEEEDDATGGTDYTEHYSDDDEDGGDAFGDDEGGIM